MLLEIIVGNGVKTGCAEPEEITPLLVKVVVPCGVAMIVVGAWPAARCFSPMAAAYIVPSVRDASSAVTSRFEVSYRT